MATEANPIILRFNEYVADRPDAWADVPSALISGMRHALNAHMGEDVLFPGEDEGTDELYGALCELYDTHGAHLYNLSVDGAYAHLDALENTGGES